MNNLSREPGAKSETFEQIINRVARSVQSRENALTDGRLGCTYPEIPGAIGSIDEHLGAMGVGIEDTLAFACDNSVPGALTLLCLLYTGYSFVLLPPLGTGGERRGVAPSIPRFCHFKITLQRNASRDVSSHYDRPESFLHLEENEAFCAEGGGESDAGRKLYLRTSGSLGSPKMAVHSQTKLVGNVLNCVGRFRLRSEDRLAIPVPIFHMYGLGAAFLPGVVAGASIDLQGRSNILRYLDRERQFNPNVAFLTPALCEMLLTARRSIRRYKSVVTAGDKIKKDTFLAFESRFGRLLNLYGSTEMGAIAAAGPDDAAEVRAVSVGKPLPGVQMRLNAAGAEPADEAEAGELWCRHAYGFAGYVDENRDWVPHGTAPGQDWFKTGDLGRIRHDGCVEVLGRCDHSVNRAGRLVLFADIESAIETIPGIECVVVVTSGESRWGRGVVAFCVPGKGGTLTGAEVRNACFEALPRYAVPEEVSILPSLPTLPNGKVDRPRLAKMAMERAKAGEKVRSYP